MWIELHMAFCNGSLWNTVFEHEHGCSKLQRGLYLFCLGGSYPFPICAGLFLRTVSWWYVSVVNFICYSVIVLFRVSIILQFWCFGILSLCGLMLVPFCSFLLLQLCHYGIVSFCVWVTVSLCGTVILLFWHSLSMVLACVNKWLHWT